MIRHEAKIIKPLTRYEYSTSAPLVKRQARTVPRRPLTSQQRHRRLYAIVGSVGVGLWIVGYQAYGTPDLGFVGFCLIGLVAIFCRKDSGGDEVATEQHVNALPLVRAWQLMTREERLKLYPRLTEAQKDMLIQDTKERMMR